MAIYYIWFDTEYSSLELEQAVLLQAALVITDERLQRAKPGDPGLNLALRMEEGTSVSPWVEKNIPEIVAASRSNEAITIAEANARIASYIDEVAGPASSEIKKRPMLAGNSLQCDWFLARKFLPGLIDRIHYRLLDVSSIKLQWLNWRGDPEFDKENLDLLKQWMPPDAPDITGKKHDAYYDIHASMAELNFYRAHFLRGKGE